ncbi:DNA polymerase III subunit delta' [Bartonella sp. CB178]|uniref:DNA polymerase III subunit delta' n=1 Tax=Bartonella sp. CB178 TaxID=3112255 RepID=UPI00300DF57B
MSFLNKQDDNDAIFFPSQNGTIFGHEGIRHFLAKMRESGRLHHALLLEGERGIGKATLAFHFSWNILSSQKGGFLQPDCSSVIWRQIVQGSCPGFLHISRRFDLKTQKLRTGISIDDIRDVIRFLNQTSQDGEWRIVIIDSADDLNKNAANAILKMLEEPPAKALFIIITHSSGKLLPTIRSRCQRIFLQPLHDNEMREFIKNVSYNREKTDAIDEKTIETIIRKSEGIPRRAALLICHEGLKITETIDSLLGQPICNVAAVHAFAQTFSSLSSTIQFQQFCDEILDKIQKKALMLAEMKMFAFSKKFAQTWQEIHQEMEEVRSFNIDKKQFVINLLFRVHRIFRESKLFP